MRAWYHEESTVLSVHISIQLPAQQAIDREEFMQRILRLFVVVGILAAFSASGYILWIGKGWLMAGVTYIVAGASALLLLGIVTALVRYAHSRKENALDGMRSSRR